MALTGRWYCDIVGGMDDKFFDNWTNQVRKGMLELCILNDIRSRKMYGYEIVRRLRKIDGLIISEGAIYPILSRLKRQGFVETSIQESAEGPARERRSRAPRPRGRLGSSTSLPRRAGRWSRG